MKSPNKHTWKTIHLQARRRFWKEKQKISTIGKFVCGGVNSLVLFENRRYRTLTSEEYALLIRRDAECSFHAYEMTFHNKKGCGRCRKRKLRK